MDRADFEARYSTTQWASFVLTPLFFAGFAILLGLIAWISDMMS
jgi:hypothetical protein